jgi:hypothetical protein
VLNSHGIPVRTLRAVAAAALVGLAAATAAAAGGDAPREPLSPQEPAADAGSAGASWTAFEWRLLGGADRSELGRWNGRSVQIGGTSIGGVAQQPREAGGSDLGEKVKAGALSLVLPGAGQIYNHQNTKGYVMIGVEAAIWGSYFIFDAQGDSRSDTYREYAGIYADAFGYHDDDYWQAVGRYMDSDAYNEALLREARALGEDPPPLVGGMDAWQWRNETYLRNYQSLRADANSAYDRRDFVILFAIINRAVSIFDAVRNAGARPADEPALGAELLGWNVALEFDSSWHNPASRCVVARRF